MNESVWRTLLHQAIETEKETMIELLKQLVREPSIQGQESSAQQIIIDTLREMGLEVDVWEPDGEKLKHHPYFASPKIDFTGSPNVVGTLRGKGAGRSIILNGHIDVVPAGELTQWSTSPYSGELIDGKLYGRGSTDMKGGNVALLMAIKAVQKAGIQLKGDVYLQSVIEEESGGLGTLAAIARGYKADAALIPEPTNMKFFPKQQGSMWFRLKVSGLAAHGGTRYEGVSAIEKSMKVMEHIRELERNRNDRISDPLYEHISIPIPINIGKISGGEWPSSVCDLVTIEGRFGVAPDEDMDQAKEEMESSIRSLSEKDSWFEKHPVTVEWFGARWVPSSLELDHPFIQVMTESYESCTGKKPKIEASPWGTDGGLLSTVGGIPCLVFGPGVTEKAHFPDEYIEVEKIFTSAQIIAEALVRWCGISEQK